MNKVPIFFREDLRRSIVNSLSSDETLDDIILEFFDRFGIFSLNRDICKISKLGQSDRGYSKTLFDGGINLVYSSPDDTNEYLFQIPIPTFKGIDNSPCAIIQSRSTCRSSVTVTELCYLSHYLPYIPLQFTHIMPPNSYNKGRKRFLYIEDGEIEYEADSLLE